MFVLGGKFVLFKADSSVFVTHGGLPKMSSGSGIMRRRERQSLEKKSPWHISVATRSASARSDCGRTRRGRR